MLQASRLPRKMQRRQFDPVRRQDSADIYGGAESITPATQIEPDVLQASRLPRKMQRRQFDPVRRQASLTSMLVQKVSRLPCRSSLMCCKCHACMPRKMQRRQFDRIRRQASADIYGGAESTTPATQSEPEVLKVFLFLHPLLFMTAKRHGGACAWPSQLTVHSVNRLHWGSLRYTADASSIIPGQCEKSEDHQPEGIVFECQIQRKVFEHQSKMQSISPHHEKYLIRPGVPRQERKSKVVPKAKRSMQ